MNLFLLERTILLKYLKIYIDTDIKIILDHQNNYVKSFSMMNNTAKKIDILAINLNVLHNYFDSSIKLFSNLYLAQFLNTSAKFSPCIV